MASRIVFRRSSLISSVTKSSHVLSRCNFFKLSLASCLSSSSSSALHLTHPTSTLRLFFNDQRTIPVNFIRSFTDSSATTPPPPSASETPLVDVQQNEENVIYKSPFGAMLKRLKVFSLTSSIAGGFAFPILVSMMSNGLPVVAQTALIGTMMISSMGTTALLHYVVKGYVVELTSSTPLKFLDSLTEEEIQTHVLSDEGKEKLKLSWYTYNLFGKKKPISDVPISELQPPVWSPHPIVTFSYQGKNYFLHPERISPQLLIALSKTLPATPSTPASTSATTSQSSSPSPSPSPSPSTSTPKEGTSI